MKRLPILTLLLVPLLPGCASPEEQKESPSVVSVKVARVREMDLDTRVLAPALVTPREQANVASRLTARVLRLGARKGDTVSADQILAWLEDSDLEAQRDEAAAAVANAEATLAKVSSGTLPVQLERARGQVAATQAALDQAQANSDRREELFKLGAIPKRELIASRTELATAKANADVAAYDLHLLETQTGTREVEIARSQLNQMRSHLSFIETQLAFAMIRSPFSGVITEQFVFPGDMVAPNVSLFTVADLSVAVARAQVPEVDAAAVQVGQECSLAASDRPEVSWSGQVGVVNAAIDTRRRTVEVWCEISNPDHELRSGTFGTVQITTGVLPRARVVPIEAVQFEEGAQRGTVLVVGGDQRAEARQVETGPPAEGWVPIRSGLEVGEIVVVSGGYGLPEGTRVEWTGDPP